MLAQLARRALREIARDLLDLEGGLAKPVERLAQRPEHVRARADDQVPCGKLGELRRDRTRDVARELRVELVQVGVAMIVGRARRREQLGGAEPASGVDEIGALDQLVAQAVRVERALVREQPGAGSIHDGDTCAVHASRCCKVMAISW